MVKVDQHGEKPRMSIRETLSERLDTRGYCWWMWTLHPSTPKAQARTSSIFLVTNPNQPWIHTRQITLKHFKQIMPEQWVWAGWRGRVGVSGGPRDTSVCATRMQEMCVCHLVLISCAHSVLFPFLWLTYGLLTCCQPSCPIKATLWWMSTKLMWSLADWWRIN